MNNLPKNLKKGCKAKAYAVPTNDLALVKINAKDVLDAQEIYGER